MGQTSRFQLILLAFFVIFIIAGVLVFSLYQGLNSKEREQVLLWGTIPESLFRAVAETDEYKATGIKVFYVEKNADSFESEFVNALAEGRGPDLILMPHDLLQQESKKLSIIPSSVFGEREYRDLFVEGSEIFLEADGVLAIPFTADPLVMYWNRTLFQNAGISKPPTTWDEFVTLSSKLSEKDASDNVRKSIAAFGGFQNVKNAKEIVSLLIMQSGSPIVSRNVEGGLDATLDSAQGATGVGSASEEALGFYTSFSNPTKPNHSWSRALPLSENAFVAGDLATYFGFASELPNLRRKNPNLNFDVATMPQPRDVKTKMTFANFNVFAIPKQSKFSNEAYFVARTLTSAPIMAKASELSQLTPSRRDLLGLTQTDLYRQVFYKSALIARAWRDPNKEQTNLVFGRMIDGITSGRETVSEALSLASSQLQRLLAGE